jgi:hypothetical protein
VVQPDLRERIRGSLLGGAVGDALGAPIEFDSLRKIQQRFGPQGVAAFEPVYGRRGAITDDTQMTLFTAEGLVLAAQVGALGRSGELVRHGHRALLRWLRTQGSQSRHPTFCEHRRGLAAPGEGASFSPRARQHLSERPAGGSARLRRAASQQQQRLWRRDADGAGGAGAPDRRPLRHRL